jgi:hypothetical protein
MVFIRAARAGKYGHMIIKINTFLVDEMAKKYGRGTTFTQKCDTCNYEKEIYTEGVQESDNSVVRF